MKIMKKVKLIAADREFTAAADRAIRKDLSRGLIELILNSDDSYRRLCAESGTIGIRIKKRSGGGALVVVRDDAEGMDFPRLKAAIGEYGKAASGLYQGHSVRGYFGHGLKDAILGLGAGQIVTIRDDVLHRATLSVDEKRTPTIAYYEPVKATTKLRKAYGIVGNGTSVQITTLPDVTINQFEKLREQLTRHYMLRRVMGDDARNVTLTYSNVVRGLMEDRLQYLEPVAEAELLNEPLVVPGQPSAHIVVKRAAVQLEFPRETPLADGGLLIRSDTTIFDHEMFHFDGMDCAECLFGEVVVPHLDELLRSDVPILSATRDGLLWSHDALKPLKAEIETCLGVLIDAERKRRAAQEHQVRSRELQQRVANAIHELNKIAKEELAQVFGPGRREGRNLDDVDPAPPSSPMVPESGFGFIYEFNNVLIEKRASLLVRALDTAVEPGATVSFALSEPKDFTLYTQQAVLEPRDDVPSILEARVYIEGRRAGAECVATATTAERRSEAMCRVVTKKPPPPPASGGLINDVKFDPRIEPRARVRFDKESGNVFIATLSPSVSLYVGPEGERAEESEASVLIAELVLEAVCREIARRGVEAGTFIAPEGAESEAMQREFARLQNKYGALIHHCFAGRAAMAPRRGRRTAAEEAERAAMPVA